MEKKTLKDYLNLNDTEQMFFALYPLMRRGDLTCENVASLLGQGIDGWDVMRMCSKNNLSTASQKIITLEEELENSKRCEVRYNG